MKFRIKQTKRDGMVALWINIPAPTDGDRDVDHNIWDLREEHITDSVLLAIAHAFELGIKAQTNLARRSFGHHTVSWEIASTARPKKAPVDSEDPT